MPGIFARLTICFVVLFPAIATAQLAEDKCKFLGNIVAGAVPSDFSTYWNQVTPENGGKWGSVEAARDVMSWTGLDVAYNTARNNNFPFKQHTLVWGQQQPPWIADLPLAEQKEEVEEWIQQFCERYPETDYIDVVNEPLHAPPVYAQALGGAGSTGWDWVVWTFEKAREYCPNARLALNDYGVINNNSSTTDYLRLIDILQDRELIDVIGEQGHFFETTPIQTIQENLTRLQATGLPVHISEFDVNIADDEDQQARYEVLFPALWQHPAVHGITLWGYRQGQIWRPDAYLIRSDGSKRPAMVWLENYIQNNPGGTFCNPPVALEEGLNSTIGVYPNPSTGNFSVNLPNGDYNIRLLDIRGAEKSFLLKSSNGTFDITIDAPAGIYLLVIGNGASTTTKRILIR